MKLVILGRQPAIGIAELESVFGGKKLKEISSKACLVDTPKLKIQHFGSILKSGEVVLETEINNWNEISKKIQQIFVKDFANESGKITLGISTYGINTSAKEIEKTGFKIRSTLKKKSGVSVRIIPSKNIALSTAVSHNNKLGLSPKKIEILVARFKNKTVVAVSEGAQNITAYAKRDQNRPKRDAFVGMLPPKLAQTMINLGVGEKQPQIAFLNNEKFPERMEILDPFCGTGTVLQEAILKGFTAFGTDLSDKMINYSCQNINWLMQEFKPFGKIGKISTGDATDFNWIDFFRNNDGNFEKNIASVVCETYLGQPFSSVPKPEKLAEVRENCNRIISNFLKNLARQIPEGTQICIGVPAWRTQNGKFSHLPLIDFLKELGYNRKEFMRVKPQDLIYYRENQVVARELLVLIRSKNVKS